MPDFAFDYVDFLKKDLITQFKDQPKLEALCEVVGEQLQEVYGFFVDMATKRWIDQAEGVQLDGIGDIVALTRTEAGALACFTDSVFVMSDEDYRNYLIFKIWKNTNHCTYYDIQNAFRMFWSTPLYYSEDPSIPATMIFETQILNPKDPSQDALRLFQAPFIKAAGVAIRIIAYTQADEFWKDIHVDSWVGRGLMITEIPQVPLDYTKYLYWGTDAATFTSTEMGGAFKWKKYLISGTNRTFVGYVSSGIDDEYPEDGEQDGYWYQAAPYAYIENSVVKVKGGGYTVSVENGVLSVQGDGINAYVRDKRLYLDYGG